MKTLIDSPKFHFIISVSLSLSLSLSLISSAGGEMETEQTEKEAIRAASAEVSHEFKTLINADDLDSLKQSQHLMYISLSLSLSLLVRQYDVFLLQQKQRLCPNSLIF